ncbi:MAG: CinA family nicotinamide mononucleotide deamidase-related protein [Planctomycetes bacterium]|nr:CinA family nicotinamide mononucleotide deamidase-related protein [Planctomycetota bacterium]
MLRVSLVTTGSELITGRCVDTNACWIAGRIATMGGEVVSIRTVGDDPPAILRAMRQALREARNVVVSGGLGPTRDDLTRECVARLAGVPLVSSPRARRRLFRHYASRGLKMPPGAEVQATVPRAARLLPNRVGSAVGFCCRTARGSIWALPGVPAELKTMFTASVEPGLRRGARARVILYEVVRTVGLPESRVEAELARAPAVVVPGVTLGFLIDRGTILVTLRSEAKARAQARTALVQAVRRVRRRLGRAVFATGGTTLEESIVGRLRRRGWTLAIAESCTGGAISARLVRVPGCSRVLLESIVCYSNASKRRRLGLRPSLFRRYGAVSRECAGAMAEAARRGARSSLGLAVTGLAGPGGGTRTRPVGRVHFAVAGSRGVMVGEHLFAGDREAVRAGAVVAALDMIRRYESQFFCTPP